MTKTDTQKIEELLVRGVGEVISKDHLLKRLKSGERLRVKFGIDPTSADLHLGHSIPLRKLKQFQDLGHQVIFLIGDFTAQIGDPSGRSDMRKMLSEKEIKQNMKDYIKQATRILDMPKVEIRYNSEWYKQKGAGFLMDLSSRFTYARLIERKEFKERIKQDIDVSLLELTYPLLQGYDSVELKSDVEIGGTDQKFNLVFARKVQKKYGQPQQDIITLPLLVGLDGQRKMSKSYGNYIKLTEDPSVMFGQIMSMPDLLIWHYFNLLTDLPTKEIEEIKHRVNKELMFIKDAKMLLARKVVTIYHGEKKAELAEKEFNKVFKEGGLPSNVPEVEIREGRLGILDLLVKLKLASSKSEAQRLVEQGGVRIGEEAQKDWRKIVEIKKGEVIQVGKRKFIKII